MPVTITRETVLHVARLARLELDDADTDRLRGDLERILEYVGELAAVDTASIAETSHVGAEATPLRADAVLPGVSTELALAEAPRSAEGSFAVPAFLEDA